MLNFGFAITTIHVLDRLYQASPYGLKILYTVNCNHVRVVHNLQKDILTKKKYHEYLSPFFICVSWPKRIHRCVDVRAELILKITC